MHVSPSWEANGRSASQEIPYLVWNTEVHCRVYNIPPLAPNLNQINAVHTFPPYLSKISSALILQSVPVSSAWPFLLRFSDHNFVCISHLFRLCYMRRPSHPPWFDNPSIWWSVQVMKLRIMQSSPASRRFRPLRSEYSPQHLFSNTLSLCSSVRVGEQDSHPYQTTGNSFEILRNNPTFLWYSVTIINVIGLKFGYHGQARSVTSQIAQSLYTNCFAVVLMALNIQHL